MMPIWDNRQNDKKRKEVEAREAWAPAKKIQQTDQEIKIRNPWRIS